MRHTTAVAMALVLASAGTMHAQQAEKASGARPAVMGMSAIYGMAKANVLKSAEQVSEDKYAFQATKEVRTFGQLLGHITDANNFFCAKIAGGDPQYEVVAEKLTSKADLSAALKKSFDACDAALAGVTDADLARAMNIFGNQANVSSAITLLTSHNWEHYGNMVTYMRLNGMTPPSSQN